MAKLRFKLSHVIARSWFCRLRRAYRLKPGVHSLVSLAEARSGRSNMSCCSGRSNWNGGGGEDDSVALLKNQHKDEAEELRKWIKEREREERQQLQKKDKGTKKKKKKKNVYPIRAYNSWCRREAPKSVDEGCHCSRKRKVKKVETKKDGEAWEREGLWSVIARVGDAKIVRKKVVLKRRTNSGGTAAVGVAEGQRAPVNSDNSDDEPGRLSRRSAPAASARNSTQQSHSSRRSSASSCSSSSACCSSSRGSRKFRLSTSSSSSGLGAHVLAWEKEQYSPFAASDKSSSNDDHGHGLGAVSKGAFLFLDHDQFTVERDCGLFEEHREDEVSQLQEKNKGLSCTKSPSKHSKWESCCFQQEGDRLLANLEGNARAWDDDLGLITSASRRHANDNVRSRRKLKFERCSYAQTGHLEGMLHQQHECEESQGGGGAKVGESVAVSMFSSDPYQDFKQSMAQMIVEKRLFKAAELEELLERYLWLNSPGYHDLIVQVFSDLWLQLFSNP